MGELFPLVIDLTGRRFGRLTVVGFSHTNRHSYWRTQCDCGESKIICGKALRSGVSQSCGCLAKDILKARSIKHGHAAFDRESAEYRSWRAMVTRCENSKHRYFNRYGGRGIKVCDRWRGRFEDFLSDMGPRPLGKSLDRWPDPNGNYEPSNCRWATPKEQRANHGVQP